MISEIFNVYFLYLQTFHILRMDTKLCDNLHSCHTLFEYLDRNSQKTNLQLVEQFSRKLTIPVFHSTWKRWEKEAKFGERIICIISHTINWKSVGIVQPFIAICEIRWCKTFAVVQFDGKYMTSYYYYNLKPGNPVVKLLALVQRVRGSIPRSPSTFRD